MPWVLEWWLCCAAVPACAALEVQGGCDALCSSMCMLHKLVNHNPYLCLLPTHMRVLVAPYHQVGSLLSCLWCKEGLCTVMLSLCNSGGMT